MTSFSPNVASLQPSATMAVSTRVKQLISEGRDILDLCVGEPDFPTPDFISEAAIAAIRGGKTRYTPAPGIPQLRAAIAADLERVSTGGSKIDPQGVVVSTGAKQALFNVCFALFGPGDQVLIPVPYWTTYPALVELSRAEPVFVTASREKSFKVTVADLERVKGPRVKGLMLNSPANPHGAVYSLEELREIAEWCTRNDVWLVSDEIYRRIYFGGQIAPGLLDVPAELRERSVVIDGASKAFAMTGWRMGFSYSSREIAAKIGDLQSQMTSNITTPTQYAALAAYQNVEQADVEIERMRRAFESRRDLLVGLFREKLPQVGFVKPEGAFYFWIETKALAKPGEDSIRFCERLLAEVGIGLVPGAAFGDDGYVRLSFAFSEDTLRQAVERFTRLR